MFAHSRIAHILPVFGLLAIVPGGISAQRASAAPPRQNDPIDILVGRLDLERYKTTLKGLTRFGDRRQGTDRNRRAIDWIEAQLKTYGCTNTERLKYEYRPPPDQNRGTAGSNTVSTSGRGSARAA